MADKKSDWEKRLAGRAQSAFDAARLPQAQSQQQSAGQVQKGPELPAMHHRPDGTMRQNGDMEARRVAAQEAGRIHAEQKSMEAVARTDRMQTSFNKEDLKKDVKFR